MAAPEVAAALISVGGSFLMACGIEASRRYINWKKSKGKIITTLRGHPLFNMHHDLKLEITSMDAARNEMLNHIKDNVLLHPVQTNMSALLSGWTDTSIHGCQRELVGDKLSNALDAVVRTVVQECAQISCMSRIVTRLLHPLCNYTIPNIKELIRSEYDGATLLTLSINIFYTSLFALIVEWNNCSNMLNGSLNNVTWKGHKLHSSYNGSVNSFIAQIKRWSSLLMKTNENTTILVTETKGEILFADGAPLPDNDPISLTTGSLWINFIPSAYMLALKFLSHDGDAHADMVHASAKTVELQMLCEELHNSFNLRNEYKGLVPLRTFKGDQVVMYNCCTDHILTNPVIDGQPDQSWCSLILLSPADVPVDTRTLKDIVTGNALLMRLAVQKFDSIVSISDIDTDIVRFRTETSPTKPLVVVNVPLHVNLGVSRWEIDAAVERCYKQEEVDLKFTTLSYVSGGIVYKAHIYCFSGLLFAMHSQHITQTPPTQPQTRSFFSFR